MILWLQAFGIPLLQITYETLRDLQRSAALADLSGAGVFVNRNLFIFPVGKVVLNAADRDPAFSIAEDGLLCQARLAQLWCGARANVGVLHGIEWCFQRSLTGVGAVYFEVSVLDEGLCRVGWSTSGAKLDLGTDQFGFGYGGTGKKSNNKQFEDYGQPYTKGDTIGCMFDSTTGNISFSKNGVLILVIAVADIDRTGPGCGVYCSRNSCKAGTVSCDCCEGVMAHYQAVLTVTEC